MRRMLFVLSPLLLAAGWGSPAHAQWSSSYGDGAYGSVRCESRDNRVAHCDVYGDGDIRLRRQLSDSPCIRNRSWGTDSRGVWVSSGCRAEFAVDGYADNDRDDDRYGGGYGDDRYGNGYGYGSADTLRCESRDRRTVRCSTGGRDAYLVRQLSDMPCRRGQSWGSDRYGVWVSNGCRALFRVDRYASGWGGNGNWGGGGNWGGNGWGGNGWGSGHGNAYGSNLVRCESRDNRSNSCYLSIGRNNGVRLLRQLSDTPCIEGQTWGRTNNGVWVTRGCRAEFVVARGGGSQRPPGDLGDGRPPGGNRMPDTLPPGVIVPPPGSPPGGPALVDRDDGNARIRPRMIDERPQEAPRDVPRIPRQFAVQTPPAGGGQPGGFQDSNPPGQTASPPAPQRDHPRLRERLGGQDDAGSGEPGREASPGTP